MRERYGWLLMFAGVIRFLAGFVAVVFLLLFLATALWTMNGLVVEPAKLVIREFRTIGNEPKVIVMAFIAASAGAWSIRFIVRLVNRRDDPQFAYLPEGPDDSP